MNITDLEKSLLFKETYTPTNTTGRYLGGK